MKMMKTFTKLYKKDNTGKVRYWYMETDGGAYRSVSGIVGREDTSEQISAWTYTEGKNIGRVNETTPEEQAFLEVSSTYRIRKEQGYAEDIKDAGKKFFQPMLADKYFSLNKKQVTDIFEGRVFIQPKLDGVRCIVTKDGMFSRQGKEIISAPHIRKSLEPVFEKYPNLIFDGELYNHDLNSDFNRIISLVRKTKPTEEDLEESEKFIQYWIYDFPSVNDVFSVRHRGLLSVCQEFSDNFDQHCVILDTNTVGSDEEVQEYLEKCLGWGYEGAIVRLDREYENKRTKSLLKVKKFEDEEFVITRIEEGKGNSSGLAARIIVDVNGKEVGAGLKFSREDAIEIWENRDKYVGKKATIKYFNKTPDGSLRFPKCIQIDRESYE